MAELTRWKCSVFLKFYGHRIANMIGKCVPVCHAMSKTLLNKWLWIVRI